MKTIKILGTGCPNCKKTEAVVRSVVAELNLNISIEKVEDIQDIIAYDVMSTPAIVIDEKVVIKGHVPKPDEIRTLLQEVCCNDTDTSCCEPVTSEEPCCGDATKDKSEPCC
jgi:small redox-active disulfide protein 2